MQGKGEIERESEKERKGGRKNGNRIRWRKEEWRIRR